MLEISINQCHLHSNPNQIWTLMCVVSFTYLPTAARRNRVIVNARTVRKRASACVKAHPHPAFTSDGNPDK